MKRILMSAYACDPNSGSEPGIGWHWAVQAARSHEVWVLTRASNRLPIEKELAKCSYSNLHFIYHDLPQWARWWKKGTRGVNLYYFLWQLTALNVARRAHSVLEFHLGHHITFGSIRFPSFLVFLKIPYIWGPVGGGERAPRRFWWSFGPKGFVQELLRDFSTVTAQFNPLVRMTANRAKLPLATTLQSAEVLPYPARVRSEVLLAIGIEAQAGEQTVGLRSTAGCFRLLYVGRLLYWKGVQFAIRAVSKLLRSGIDVHFTIIGEGPTRPALEALSSDLCLEDSIDFKGSLPRQDVLAHYSQNDVFVFPSFHDSGGFVVLEAMAAGLPVVCLDLGGPSSIVTVHTGICVPAKSPKALVTDLEMAILQLANNPGQCRAMGLAGRTRVEEFFEWEERGYTMRQFYDRVGSPS